MRKTGNKEPNKLIIIKIEEIDKATGARVAGVTKRFTTDKEAEKYLIALDRVRMEGTWNKFIEAEGKQILGEFKPSKIINNYGYKYTKKCFTMGELRGNPKPKYVDTKPLYFDVIKHVDTKLIINVSTKTI